MNTDTTINTKETTLNTDTTDVETVENFTETSALPPDSTIADEVANPVQPDTVYTVQQVLDMFQGNTVMPARQRQAVLTAVTGVFNAMCNMVLNPTESVGMSNGCGTMGKGYNFIVEVRQSQELDEIFGETEEINHRLEWAKKRDADWLAKSTTKEVEQQP